MVRVRIGRVPTRGAVARAGVVGLVDVVIALVVVLTAGRPDPPVGLFVTGALVCAAPLLWSGTAPTLVMASPVLLLFGGGLVSGLDWVPATFGDAWAIAMTLCVCVMVMPAVFMTARLRPLPFVAAALAFPFAVAVALQYLTTDLPDATILPGTLVGVLSLGILTSPFWSSGALLRRRAIERAEQAERERARAERTVREERARIARELHGLVLADLALIGRGAHRAHARLDEAGEDVDGAAHEEVRAALTTVTTTGRETLTAMRRLLGMLRGLDPDDPAREPQPTLDRLDELVDRARASGRPVTLTVTGPNPSLPDEVDLATYRIVQEVLGRAGPGPVELTVTCTEDAVELTAVGDLHPVAGPVVGEWVRLLRGTVRRTPPRKFEARLPVHHRRP